MAWPYKFVALDPDGVALRRASLDRHAAYAQYSALLPLALFLVLRAGRWGARRIAGAGRRGGAGAYDSIPDSPALKSRRQSALGTWEASRRRGLWWLGDEIVIRGESWGERGQWAFGLGWFTWLIVLCVVGTGDGKSVFFSQDDSSCEM